MTGGGAYTGPKAWRHVKPSVSGPLSNSTSKTSLPISRLKTDDGLSRIGKVKPDLLALPWSLPAPKTLPLLPFVLRASLTSVSLLAVAVSMSEPALPGARLLVGETSVSSALSPLTVKLPIGMRQVGSPAPPPQSGRWLIRVVSAAILSTKSSLGPPARVLNVLARVIRLTSPPPAIRLRSDSTGIGA